MPQVSIKIFKNHIKSLRITEVGWGGGYIYH